MLGTNVLIGSYDFPDGVIHHLQNRDGYFCNCHICNSYLLHSEGEEKIAWEVELITAGLYNYSF